MFRMAVQGWLHSAVGVHGGSLTPVRSATVRNGQHTVDEDKLAMWAKAAPASSNC